MKDGTFETLLNEVRQCKLCEPLLPFGARPVVQMHRHSKILIAGQAPGSKVHASGVPFDDASGNRLREWMGLTTKEFYNPELVAILPMGFCFPGTGKSGDLPPRPECEKTWRARLLSQLKHLELTLVLGGYAQAYHFGKRHKTLTELVESWRDYWPSVVPMPHPSPRNNVWMKRNPWFEKDVIPGLQERIKRIKTN